MPEARGARSQAAECGRLGAIFGNGRSGTTWLGAIVSSHPEVVYRFEPLHRAELVDESARIAARTVRSARFTSLDLPTVYQAMLPAYPEWEKPPFFQKNFRMRLGSGRSLLWPLARSNRALQALFRYLYTPLDHPYVVFKEVAAEDSFISLVVRTEIPMIYILRHPCGAVHSIVQGQKKGLLRTGRQNVLSAYMKDHAPALWDRYRGRIEAMSAYQKEALLWRTNVELCYEVIKQNPRVLVVFYEDLCRDPLKISTQVLQTLGLEMDEKVRAFIEASMRPRSSARFLAGEVGIRPFFSVFRDPVASMNSWKLGLSPRDRREIVELVKDGEVFAAGARIADWDG